MSKQVITQRGLFAPAGTTSVQFPSSLSYNGFAFQAYSPWAVAGTFRNMVFSVKTAPGSGKSWTGVLWRGNGSGAASATAITFTIADLATTGSDTSNSLTVAANDYFYIAWTGTGTPAATDAIVMAVEFEADDPQESGYSIHFSHPNGASSGNGIFWSCARSTDYSNWNDVPVNAFGGAPKEAFANIVSVPGSITRTSARNHQNPGGGIGYQLAIWKSLAATPDTFVKQDGSGGTVDTRVNVVGTTLWASADYDLPVAVGDRVYMEATLVGVPFNIACGYAIRFSADTAGLYVIGGWSSPQLQDTTQYLAPHGLSAANTTEADNECIGNPTALQLLEGIRLRRHVPSGASKTATYTLRKSGSDTGIAVTIAGATDTYGISPSTTPVLIEDGDTFSLRSSGTSGITLSQFTWSFAAGGPPILGAFAAGQGGTVVSSRTALFNLDGVTRTLTADAEGSLVVGGNLMLIEQASGPTGIANSVRLYAIDNGAGKTKLMAQFGSGAAVQIAIEP
jgi:hypothetical protein